MQVPAWTRRVKRLSLPAEGYKVQREKKEIAEAIEFDAELAARAVKHVLKTPCPGTAQRSRTVGFPFRPSTGGSQNRLSTGQYGAVLRAVLVYPNRCF